MILFSLLTKLFESKLTIITNEINISYVEFLAPTLYTDDTLVSGKNIDVIDYYIYDNKIYIKPINREIIMPISGLITKINNTKICISNINDSYIIYKIDKKNILLYQHYDSYTSLGYTEDYYIIEGNDLNNIVKRLNIVYEEV
jgi:hypothetical protein